MFFHFISGFWTVVLEKTLENPLDYKEIQPVHPKGDQSWVFNGRTDVKAETPILWPPYAKSWLIGKDPDAGKDWEQEEKGTTEDEMAEWHHWLDGHGFGWTLRVGDGQGGWHAAIHGVTRSRTWLSNWTELNWTEYESCLYHLLALYSPTNYLPRIQTAYLQYGSYNHVSVWGILNIIIYIKW